MKTLVLFGVLSVGAGILLAACSSKQSGTDGANSGQPGFHVGTGGSGSSVAGGQVAQDTVDGTASITADTAASLTGDKCAGWQAEPEGGQPPVLEFVIDASGSMVNDPANPANPNGPNKWTVMSQTMPTVFDNLPDNFAIGDTFYNLSRGTYAGRQAVPIAPLGAAGSAQRNAMNNSFNSVSPTSWTPTYNAWLFGLDQLVNWPPVTGYGTSPKAIVVITDGVPTVYRDGQTTTGVTAGVPQAEYDWMISDIQQRGTAANVKTYVVGVVGSENPQGSTYDPLYMLSKFAVAGGTESPQGCVPVSGTVTPQGNTSILSSRGTYCHIDLSQASDLSSALISAINSIAQGLLSCDYSVPAPPTGQTIDPAETALVYNDGTGNYSLILENTSGSCDKGWVFTDSTNSKIHICDKTCNLIQSNARGTLSLVFGCAVSSIPLVN
jgi:hypothetical protein